MKKVVDQVDQVPFPHGGLAASAASLQKCRAWLTEPGTALNSINIRTEYYGRRIRVAGDFIASRIKAGYTPLRREVLLQASRQAACGRHDLPPIIAF